MILFALFFKELRSYFVSPLFYVVTSVFLCLCGYYFYTDLSYFVTFGFGASILQNFWGMLLVDLRLVMLLTIPLMTMRSFAEERKLGTIELLLTYPIRDGVVVAAKFAACAVVVTFMLAGTILYPALVHAIQPFPWEPVAVGYLGLLLLALSFIACGLFISSLTESQVVAGLVTIGILLLFWILDWNESAARQEIVRVLNRVAMFGHFETFSKGVIDAGDLSYFVFFIAFFNFLTLRVLESRKWRGRR